MNVPERELQAIDNRQLAFLHSETSRLIEAGAIMHWLRDVAEVELRRRRGVAVRHPMLDVGVADRATDAALVSILATLFDAESRFAATRTFLFAVSALIARPELTEFRSGRSLTLQQVEAERHA